MLAVIFNVLLARHAAANVRLRPPVATAVASPLQLQQAVRTGAQHIVITEHLDMMAVASSLEAARVDDGVSAVVASVDGGRTQSLRVRRPLRTSNDSRYPQGHGYSIETVYRSRGWCSAHRDACRGRQNASCPRSAEASVRVKPQRGHTRRQRSSSW